MTSEYVDGEVRLKNDPEKKVAFAEVAFAATDFSWQGPGSAPADIEPGLEATSRFEPSNATFPFGTHICVVEIDAETGEIELQRFLAVDDCGNVINPLIVDGQVHGGIAQGLAQAMFEEVVYHENGQLRHRQSDGLRHAESASDAETRNRPHSDAHAGKPARPKGAARPGTIGSIPAVANAVIDALAPFGVTHMEMPFRQKGLEGDAASGRVRGWIADRPASRVGRLLPRLPLQQMFGSGQIPIHADMSEHVDGPGS